MAIQQKTVGQAGKKPAPPKQKNAAPASNNSAKYAGQLTKMGWPVKRIGLSRAAKLFQEAYALGEKLTADGVIGPKTAAALDTAMRAGGRLSPHFGDREFACRCGGKYGCDVIWVKRDLLLALEKLRGRRYPHGLRIVSGCRCPKHNAAVGGAKSSQHLTGRAADIPEVVSVSDMRSLGLFKGIGYQSRSMRVTHVDVRSGGGVQVWPYR